MYHYIEDKEFLREMKRKCAYIVNQLVQEINNDEQLRVEANLVGSGAKNLITQNAQLPIDLDYNLNILEVNSMDINKADEKSLKNYVKDKFDYVLNKNGWGYSKDSTSCLTTRFQKIDDINNDTKFSIDLAIVHGNSNDGTWFRLIHKKTGDVNTDEWYWNEAPHSKGLREKVSKIKENGYWEDVRKAYLEKKNMYLRRNDNNHPSFICYIESVNETYKKYFK